MNKKFTKLIAALALLVFMTPTMAGWGQTRDSWSWTATSGALGTTSPKQVTLNNKSWTVTRSSVVYTGWTSNCIQMGSSSGAETVTLTSNDFSGVITKVEVECSSYKSYHSISIKVGGSTYLASTATASWTTVSKKSGTGSASGEIEISFTPNNSSARAVYIKSISVTYETGGSSSDPVVTITQPTGGTIAVSNNNTNVPSGTSVAAETTLTLSNTPGDAYTFGSYSVYKTGDQSTTVEVNNGSFTMPDYNVTVTGTFNAKPTHTITLTQPTGGVGTIASNPSGSAYEGQTVTLTAAEVSREFASWNVTGATVADQNNPITTFTMSSQDVTVSATFTENPNADFLTASLVTAGMGSGTGYKSWSDITSNSGVKYSGESNKIDDYIQIRNSNPSGIVSTTSGGYVRKVALTWKGSNGSGRKLIVFGKNSAYSGPSELYDANKRGDTLGIITYGTSTELVISGNYEFVGIKADGSAYFEPLKIVWEPIACPRPTNVAVSNATPTSLKLSWTAVAAQTAWVVAYSTTTGFDPEDETVCTLVNADENPVVVTGLTAETQYYFRVKGDCGTDGESTWSAEVTGTTLDACPKPFDLAANSLTPTTANITWTGYSDSYSIQYRTAEGYDFEVTEDFSGVSATGYNAGTYYLPEGWMSYNTTANAPRVSNSSQYTYIDELDGNFLLMSITTDQQSAYAIMPKYSAISNVTFNYVYESTSNGTLTIGYVTDNTGYSTYQVLQTPDKNAQKTSFTLTDEDVATINNANGYIAFCYQGKASSYYYSVGIDDVVITGGEYHAAVAWSDPALISTTESIQLSGLTASTRYEVQVKGNCDGGVYSDVYRFTTPPIKTFTISGDWNEAANWIPTGVPTAFDDVVINAACVIPANCIAEANNITIGTDGSLTIEDGGQLYTEDVVEATIKKNIKKYTIEANDDTDPDNVVLSNGWYFISYPLNCDYTEGGDDPTGVTNLITDNSTYDLYLFDPEANQYDQENGEEWVNYKAHTLDFKLITGHGYLYANAADVTLEFAGSVNYTDPDNPGISLENGYNLVGNPYAYNAYPSVSYYKMNNDGTAITADLCTDVVPPCTGIIVDNSDGSIQEITFSKPTTDGAINNGNQGNLEMTLSQQVVNTRGNSKKTLDNAIVSFNEGSQLGKFYFGTQNANLYIPQGTKEYAIVSSEAQGEMPVNFRANENGQYTLTVNPENVEMNYLHLIDNMTGTDIDLLQTPSYSFNATTTDYESRFMLVFASDASTGSASDETFAFYSNGNWVINNAGNATLQVVDLMGRILSSETVNGSVSKTINATPGVYMLRLINGENVKVQKIVVR